MSLLTFREHLPAKSKPSHRDRTSYHCTVILITTSRTMASIGFTELSTVHQTQWVCLSSLKIRKPYSSFNVRLGRLGNYRVTLNAPIYEICYWCWRCRGIVVWPLDSHVESPSSNPTVARYFCPSAIHFIHIAALDPGVKWGPGRMRTILWLSWHCARL